jgi:hypothetical protein
MSRATAVYRAQCVFVGKSSLTFSRSRSSPRSSSQCSVAGSTAQRRMDTQAGMLQKKLLMFDFVGPNWVQQQLESLTDCTGWTILPFDPTLKR